MKKFTGIDEEGRILLIAFQKDFLSTVYNKVALSIVIYSS